MDQHSRPMADDEEILGSPEGSSKREKKLLDLLGKASNFYEETIGILSGIFRLSEFVGKASLEDEFFSFLVNVLVEESRCNNASVFLVEGDRIALKAATGIHNTDINKEVTMALGEGVAGICTLEGTTVLVNDISECEFFVWRPDSKVEIGSMLCIPIREGKKTIGVFNLSHPDKNFFTINHVRMFELLGLIVGQLTTLVGLNEVFQQEYMGLKQLVLKKEEGLKEITMRYKAIIDATDELIIILHHERVTFSNNALKRMVGGVPETIHDIFDPASVSSILQQFSMLPPEGCVEFDIPVEIGKRHRIIGQFFIKQLTDDQNLIMTKDISLKRHMEQRSIQNEKLTSLGLLTSGIAHELNNKLTPILGFAELIDVSALNETDKKRFSHMMNSANSAKNIMGSLLSFSRNLPPEKTPFEIREVIERIINLYSSTLHKKDIKIIHVSPPEPLNIKADMNCIEQVLVNLINNAIDAIGKVSGSISIRSFARDGFVHVQIEDSGPGIPEGILPKIFDPFFTTKSLDKGTGLGLSICYGIVTDHKGEITIENTGHGTLAQIKLPGVPCPETAHPATPDQAPEAQVIPGKRTEKCLIMVVEDEEELQHLMVDALTPKYEAHCYRNGREACNNLQGFDWDLIISDLRMPEMDGMEFYREMQKRCPGLEKRFIFVTGDTYDREVKRFLEETGVTFIRKPFRIKEFRDIVQNKIGA